VTPVTHSIGNCIKRVVVIVASIIIFQNPVSTQNAIGARRSSPKPGSPLPGWGGAWARGAARRAAPRLPRPVCRAAWPSPALSHWPSRSPRPAPAGTSMALFGVFLYSQAKRKYKSAPKTA
jgi:hypothetical protein